MSCIDQVEAIVHEFSNSHLSSQTIEQIDDAITQLYAQNIALQEITGEEAHFEADELKRVRLIMSRLFKTIAIYEDYKNRVLKEEKDEMQDLYGNGIKQWVILDQMDMFSIKKSASFSESEESTANDPLVQSTKT